MRRFRNHIALLAMVATLASGTCYLNGPETPYDENGERTPCTAYTSTGSCGQYLVCVQGIVCVDSSGGFHQCNHNTIVAPARIFIDGILDYQTFCCDGGQF